MKTVLGPFHPDLENALVEEILGYKKDHPLSALLVLVPSDALRRHLKTVLARERGLALLNVQPLTFYQLALRLHEESNDTPPQIYSELFLEEVLRRLIRARRTGAETFAGIEERAGGCAALWQTLRDLRDGLVDPAVALDALGEGHFSRRGTERTQHLLVLLRTVQEFCLSREITDPSELIRSAAERAPASKFLKTFERIFYYGFYDLTQTQIEFFHAVARHYPTTLFFPYLPVRPAHEAWSFARRFYQRHVQGQSTEPASEIQSAAALPATARLFDDEATREYAAPAQDWQCRITTTFGLHDEVATAAKEILRLIDDQKFQFHQIGVVARSLESYGQLVKEIFHAHKIPLAGAFEEPLAQFPLTKAVNLLLNLPAKDFVRSQVIDLVSSPYFQFHDVSRNRLQPRPDLWDLATRELAIGKGLPAWRRLRRFTGRDLPLRQISDDDEPRILRIPAAQLAYLADTVETLAADLLRLPPVASWQEYAAHWKKLLGKYLCMAPTPGDDEPGATILGLLDQLAALDRVQDRVELGDFSRTFEHWLERSGVTDDRRNRDGVQVHAAAAARGLSFRALFILGLNEGVFPRTIREDAFLRDEDREILERDLGYKVGPKLAAFDEEKLLFALLVGAARERLYCSFQRADDSGRALAPSWYVAELERALKEGGLPCERSNVPRGVIEKSAAPPFDREDLLLPAEMAIRLTLEGRDPTALIDAAAPLPALYRQGRRALGEIEQSADLLLPYDGVVADISGYWKHFSERGLSPTALETYARCPFQFFALHVLGLKPLDRPEEVLGPSPAEYGELGHAILNSFYGALIDGGYFAGKAATIDVDMTLRAAASRAFADYEEKNPTGYPLAWETLKEGLVELLRQVIARDLNELKNSGLTPVSLETEVTARLPADWPEPLGGLAIHGRMDRVDRGEARLRVVDYKFKFGAGPSAQDRNLIRSALRGEKLQPAFYVLLAQRWAEGQSKSPGPFAVEADLYYIAPRWSEGPLISASYGGEELTPGLAAAIRQTIAALTDGVRRGRFFIHRGDYCGRCDAAPICRKNHPPSLWRADNDPLTRPHRALRKKDLKNL
jgi:ATP-dependent helicase/nuclease subunit B